MSHSNPYRLLLINPWIYDFTAFDLWSKPIGLLYIAAYLRELGYQIDFLDCLDKNHPVLTGKIKSGKIKFKKYGTGPFPREHVEKPAAYDFVPRYYSRFGMPEELFVEQLKQFSEPDAILVTSFMTYWYPGLQHVLRIVRRIFPDIPVILGGIYTTLMPDHVREMLQPDYLIEGAGEVKIAELLADILDGAPRPPAAIRSLDDFPFPAFEMYTKLNYLPLMTSRGCPYHCTFCATDKISGAYAQRTPEAVFQEIRHFVGKFRIRDIAFYDDALLLNAGNRIIPLLEKIIQSRMPVRFHTPNGLHAGQMNKQVAALFSQAGFSTIRLSFETASPERLNDMNFKVTPDQLSDAVQNLESAGYSRSTIESYVMMGLPHQTFQEIYESIIFVHSLGIKVRLASFSPIPGTPDYEKAVSEGLFPDQADPLLTNKTIYPLHRNIGAFRKFSEIRQLVNAVNQATERQTKLFSPPELRNAFEKILNNGLDG